MIQVRAKGCWGGGKNGAILKWWGRREGVGLLFMAPSCSSRLAGFFVVWGISIVLRCSTLWPYGKYGLN